MAGTIHSVWVVRSSEEKESRRRKDPRKALGPDFNHKATLWIDGRLNPCWVGEELTSTGLAAPGGELCKKMTTVLHDQFAASESQSVAHHEVAAFLVLLRACTKNKDLYRGTRLHDDILKKGLLEKCSDALVIMYAKCGALVKAQALINMHKSRNVVPWTALIAGYARERQSQDALNCFEHMQREGVPPNAVTYACILKACGTIGAIDKGEQIHDKIERQGLLQNDIVLGNALVDMYAKCGALAKAKCVLEELSSRNVISWSALIAGYAQQGQAEQALDCFERMQHEGIPSDAVTYVCVLKACGTIRAAEKGEQIHDKIARQGLLRDNVVLGTALVDMYAKCGALAKAEGVLEELSSRNVVSWSALIAGYAQQGQGEQALDCFQRMQHEGISPNAVTYACVLKVCGNIGAADNGKEIHEEIVRQGLLRDNLVLGTALVDMYAKCGALTNAEHVLEDLPCRNVVSWNALIAGYAQHGQGEQALDCFERLKHEGIPPDAVTYACVLKACGTIGAADQGKQIHDEIARQGLLRENVVLGNALVDMYGKCGALSKAEHVLEELPLRNVVSWNTLIAGYTQHGHSQQALDCFERMQHEGIPPDVVTYACILKACGAIGAVDKGKRIHEEIRRQGLLRENIMLGTALVDMYAKCGALAKAECILGEIPSRNVVSWNALIAGYAQHGQGEKAMDCFECMQHEGITPDVVTYICLLRACGAVGAADNGEQIHDKIAGQGLLQDDIVLGNALVDMYGKCGALAKAEHVLEELPSRNVVSWNALIAGYVQVGKGEQALDCLERMQQEGIPPDASTFGCVLNVCSHLGLVEEGHTLFVNMCTKFSVTPDLECYTCMVDLFGRAGHLERAVRVLREMPSSDYSAIWHALLGACRKWGDANVGRWAFDQAVQVDKRDAASYVLMANIYAGAGMQENAKNIETMRIENKAWRKPG